MNTKLPSFGGTSSSGNDSKYFQTTKKGEIHELKEELANPKMEKKKEAVKKVVAAMTVGKDVVMLFTDVVNCIQTQNIELKKLVYLYLINYAKSQPDLAILAVNTFVKDTQDPNPLIRALAVRTMGCIRVDKIVEYLCEPLRKCLTDADPYVRKTAAVCVAKLYDINGELVEDQLSPLHSHALALVGLHPRCLALGAGSETSTCGVDQDEGVAGQARGDAALVDDVEAGLAAVPGAAFPAQALALVTID